ncbi:PREDICTED: uncharacterized protein LOC109225939 [Nicotiana attenuata]|nr:PREDICTED: uncharacterized protein LOC109225939 [Nicotiana attenuata]
MPSYLRQLFAIFLLSNLMTRPEYVWQSTWQLLSEDILHEERVLLTNPELTDDELKNRCLQKLEKVLKSCGRSFQDFPTMPGPLYNEEEVDHSNRLIHDELCYNRRSLLEEHQQLLMNLTAEQKSAYDKIMRAVNEAKGDIVLTIASSGIASLLLPGGRTTHSRFAIPLNPTEDSTCNIKQALDQTLRDILDLKTHPVLINLLEVKQLFLVATSDIFCLLLQKDLCKILLTIGSSIDGIEKVQIPDDLLISNCDDPISAIVESTYPDFFSHSSGIDYLQQREILALILDMEESINEYMVSLNHSPEKTYLSSDTVCMSDHSFSALEHVHTPEFLNSIKCSVIPNHSNTLKVGVLVMLLRNIDRSSGLCNGTRLIITRLENRIIEAKVLSGNMAGQKVFIPRMTLTPSDARIPFNLQRRQFPIVVSFAMTIIKSQGQSLSHVE